MIKSKTVSVTTNSAGHFSLTDINMSRVISIHVVSLWITIWFTNHNTTMRAIYLNNGTTEVYANKTFNVNILYY